MAAILVGNWWVLALRGVLAILFAILAFVLPLFTAAVMVLVFAAYCLVDGIFALIAGLRAASHHGRSGPLLIEGVLNLLIGIFFFLWPGAALEALSARSLRVDVARAQRLGPRGGRSLCGGSASRGRRAGVAG